MWPLWKCKTELRRNVTAHLFERLSWGNIGIPSVGGYVEHPTSPTAGGQVTWHSHSGRVCQILVAKHAVTIWPSNGAPAVEKSLSTQKLVLNCSQELYLQYPQTGTCPVSFDRQMNKPTTTSQPEKKNEVLIDPTIWLDLRGVMLSENNSIPISEGYMLYASVYMYLEMTALWR